MHFFNIRYTLILLNIIGSHPGKVGSTFQTFVYYSIFVCLATVLLLMGINMFNNNITAKEFATTLAEFFVIFHPAAKIYMLYTSRSIIWQLLIQMDNTFWAIEDKTNSDNRKYYEQVLIRLKNIFGFIGISGTGWMIMTVSLSELPFKCYVPKWIPLQLLIVLEDVICVAICVSLQCSDMLFVSIVTLLSLQVRMLNENIGNIFDVGSFDKMKRRELKAWIEHHCFLLKYAATVNKAFSRGMMVYLGDLVAVLCTCIYILSISDVSNIASVMPTIIVILPGYIEFVVCYCAPAQALMNEVERIDKTVYLTNWVQYLEYSSTVNLITVRSQKGVALTTGDFGKLGLETSVRVLNTVISYFMFLKTMIDA